MLINLQCHRSHDFRCTWCSKTIGKRSEVISFTFMYWIPTSIMHMIVFDKQNISYEIAHLQMSWYVTDYLSTLVQMSFALSQEAITWWRHQKETFSALLSLCEGNSRVTGEFPSQRPVTRSFEIFFDLRQSLRRHRAHYDVTVMTWKEWSILTRNETKNILPIVLHNSKSIIGFAGHHYVNG